jgi:hypothetical protein
MRRFRLLSQLLAISSLLIPSVVRSQVADPVTTALAPVPGVGHNYIGIGAETVNPADGSISFELPIQTPPGRQLSFPFGIRFSSSELFSITNNTGAFYWVIPQAPPFQLNGWSYELPNLTGATVQTNQQPDPSGRGTDYCLGSANVVFRGFQGTQVLGAPPFTTINQWPYTPPPANISNALPCWASMPTPQFFYADNGAVATVSAPLNDPMQPRFL